MTGHDDRSPADVPIPRGRSLALAAVLLTALAACGGSPEGAVSRPNVLLVVIDTLRADHLSPYGYPRDTAPELSRLAQDGVTFQQAFSTAPWTTPSVAAILTGRHPGALGIADEPIRLPPEAPLLAPILAGQGYATHGVVSHTYIGRELGFAAGFDTWDESQVGMAGFVSSPGVTDRALRVLEERSDAPFFLFVHYFDPHWDYIEHAEHGFVEDPPPPSSYARGGIWKLRAAAQSGKLGEAELQRVIDAYDSEIRLTDAHIGRLLRFLREHDLHDETLVVVTADHGEAFMDRPNGWIGHAREVFQEQLRVPLIVKPPGGVEPRVVADFVSTVDVLPTILDVVGVAAEDAPVSLERSLLRETSGRAVHAETRRYARWQTVAHDGWKLTRNLKTGKVRLFWLAEDPGERLNRAEQNPEIVARLEKLRKEWAEGLARTRLTGAAPVEHSAEELERLRALGYVE